MAPSSCAACSCHKLSQQFCDGQFPTCFSFSAMWLSLLLMASSCCCWPGGSQEGAALMCCCWSWSCVVSVSCCFRSSHAMSDRSLIVIVGFRDTLWLQFKILLAASLAEEIQWSERPGAQLEHSFIKCQVSKAFVYHCRVKDSSEA